MEEGVIRDSCSSYPKLWALGHGAIADIFNGDVIVEEKIDGSQFSFGIIRGELKCRSKSVLLNLLAPEKMFVKACETARKLADSGFLTPEWTYRCEYLAKPKHNSLAYERIPIHHLIGFDISTGFEQLLSDKAKRTEFTRIGLEVVPQIFAGKIDGPSILREFLERISILGGQLVEGVVVKNYSMMTKLGQVAMGKFVSEAFKEVHQNDWKERGNDRKDFIENLISDYRTPSRWHKAVQHLKEQGNIENSPKDIGALIREVPLDILAECETELKDKIFKRFWPEIARGVTHGLPQWYKEELMKQAFNGDQDGD